MRMTRRLVSPALFLTVAALAAGCSDSQELPTDARTSAHAERGGPPGADPGTYTFDRPVFDIEATPNGNILVAETVLGGFATGSSTIWEIVTRGRQSGQRKMAEFTTPDGVTPIHGMAAVGQRGIYAARGGLDAAANAAVVQITPAGSRVVADIETFETEMDPDLFAIGDWKDPVCAMASGPFTPGPQSNPYGLASVSGNTFLVADAAGNTLLRAKSNGTVELVALFTPPTEGGGASDDPADWLEFPFDAGTPDDPSDDPTEGNCYVQPVPNSVAVGGDGAIYVGELIGVGALGVSRVWRIEPDAEDVVCPSSECEMVLGGLTSIINMTFGPDGHLYVVEYDEAGWLSAFGAFPPEGGTVKRCDVDAGTCEVATLGGEEMSGLTFPAALTFDGSGDAWLLENNLVAPTVRKLD